MHRQDRNTTNAIALTEHADGTQAYNANLLYECGTANNLPWPSRRVVSKSTPESTTEHKLFQVESSGRFEEIVGQCSCFGPTRLVLRAEVSVLTHDCRRIHTCKSCAAMPSAAAQRPASRMSISRHWGQNHYLHGSCLTLTPCLQCLGSPSVPSTTCTASLFKSILFRRPQMTYFWF